jgi:hypothetical protein
MQFGRVRRNLVAYAERHQVRPNTPKSYRIFFVILTVENPDGALVGVREPHEILYSAALPPKRDIH